MISGEPIANRILLALPTTELKEMLPMLHPVDLHRGHALYRPGELIQVFFVNRGMVSLVQTMRDGRTVEVGTIAIEGVTTPEVLFGIDAALFQSVVQVPGTAFAIHRDSLQRVMKKMQVLKELLQGYVHVAAPRLGKRLPAIGFIISTSAAADGCSSPMTAPAPTAFC